MTSIQIHALTKQFNEKIILKDLTFKFEVGRIYVLKGESGVGKTTLLNVIGLLDMDYHGQIFYDETIISDHNRNVMIRNEVSFIFHSTNLIMELNCIDNLRLVNSDLNEIKILMAALNIEHLAYVKTLQISKGEKLRLSIARAILENKNVLLLDEPTSNLDDKAIELVMNVLYKYAQHKIVIISSHLSNELIRIPHEVLEFNDYQLKHIKLDFDEKLDPIKIPMNKPRRSIILFFKMPLKILDKMKGRYIIFTLIQMSLIMLFLITLSLLFFNGNSKITTKLLDSHLNYVELDTYQIDTKAYRKSLLYAKINDNNVSLNVLFNPDNTFNYQSQTFELNDNEIVLSNHLADLYHVEINDMIQINNIEIKVINIYQSNILEYTNFLFERNPNLDIDLIIKDTIPAFMSMNIMSQLLDDQLITYQLSTFDQIKTDLNEINQSIVNNLTIKLSNQSELLSNEIKIVLSNQFDLYDYSSMINTPYLILESPSINSIDIGFYVQDLVVKEVMFSNELASHEMIVILSHTLTDNIYNDVLKHGMNGLFKLYIDASSYDQIDFMNNGIHSYGVIDSKLYDLYINISLYKSYVFLALSMLFIFESLLIFLILSGTMKVFSYQRYVFKLLGVRLIQRSIVYSTTPIIKTILLTIICSLMFFINLENINSFILKQYNILDIHDVLNLDWILVVGLLFTMILMITINSFLFNRLKYKNILKLIKESVN